MEPLHQLSPSPWTWHSLHSTSPCSFTAVVVRLLSKGVWIQGGKRENEKGWTECDWLIKCAVVCGRESERETERGSVLGVGEGMAVVKRDETWTWQSIKHFIWHQNLQREDNESEKNLTPPMKGRPTTLCTVHSYSLPFTHCSIFLTSTNLN